MLTTASPEIPHFRSNEIQEKKKSLHGKGVLAWKAWNYQVHTVHDYGGI